MYICDVVFKQMHTYYRNMYNITKIKYIDLHQHIFVGTSTHVYTTCAWAFRRTVLSLIGLFQRSFMSQVLLRCIRLIWVRNGKSWVSKEG